MTAPPFASWMSRTAAALIAAALLLPTAPAAAEPLGRLFLTPERRAALERQRQLNTLEARIVEGATLSVNGVVQRSSGRSTAWINGAAQNDGSTASGVHVEIDRSQPGRTTVVAGEEAPTSLKVGETINRATRETNNGIGGGRIEVKRPAPAAAR